MNKFTSLLVFLLVNIVAISDARMIAVGGMTTASNDMAATTATKGVAATENTEVPKGEHNTGLSDVTPRSNNFRILSSNNGFSCLCSGCGSLTSTECSYFDSLCYGDAVTLCTTGGSSASCTSTGSSNQDCDTGTSSCSSACGQIGCTTYSWSCQQPADDSSNTCFHESTMITYKDKIYSLADFQAGKEPECKVPHTPTSKGVVVTAKCNEHTHTVRVTDTHLIATSKGFQLAYSLQAGDVLFNDMDNKALCTVTSVVKEQSVERYFGLNCLSSEVLANGIKASTFGDFHTLPAWYMNYAGSLVGIDTASFMGDYIAEWYFGTSKNKTN